MNIQEFYDLSNNFIILFYYFYRDIVKYFNYFSFAFINNNPINIS